MNIIEATGLGKRYRGTWALRECTLAVPEGHVVALVGPNGAGKTTLLNMSVGLTTPTEGRATVLGGQLAGSAAALDGTAFVAQDAPLYKNLSAGDMLHLTRNVNRRWDQRYTEVRLAELGIPLTKKAGKLSGGQQAQLALTLALARRPRPTSAPSGCAWCMPGAPRPRPTCWSGPAERTRPPATCRPDGRRTRSAWKNSSWPTCARPAPRRCRARYASVMPRG